MALQWYKCKGGVWCDLFQLDLEHEYLQGIEGVYVIWSGIDNKSTLKIGSGMIAQKLMKETQDLAVQAFSHLGVYVSWAEVSSFKRDGYMVYLFNELNPKLPVQVPTAIPFKINLPW